NGLSGAVWLCAAIILMVPSSSDSTSSLPQADNSNPMAPNNNAIKANLFLSMLHSPFMPLDSIFSKFVKFVLQVVYIALHVQSVIDSLYLFATTEHCLSYFRSLQHHYLLLNNLAYFQMLFIQLSSL